LNISFRDELLALGTWTDLILIGCGSRGGSTHFSHCGGAGLCKWGRLRLCCCVALPRRIVLVWCGSREQPSRCSLWHALRLSLSYLFPGVPAASIVGGMWLNSLWLIEMPLFQSWHDFRWV
jgi:hypothetical protein